MAITLKKDKKVQEAVPVTPTETVSMAYLPEEVRAEVAKLPETIVAKFAAANELTPELIEAVMPDLPETLTESLLELMEAAMQEQLPDVTPAPAQEVTAQVVPATDADTRKAQRDALKAEILANSKTVPAPAAKVEQPAVDGKPETVKTVKPAPQAASNPFDALFPVGQQVTIVNRGSGHFEVFVGGVAPATVQPATPKAEETGKGKRKSDKPKASDVVWDLMTDEYFTWMETIRTSYPTLEDKVKHAESLGLVRGKDWANISKSTGDALPPAIENMYIMDPLRKAMGVEKYIEGARTSEERNAIIKGTAPMPAGAKHRKKGTGEVIS